MDAGAVDLLIVSEGLRKHRVVLKCGQCGQETVRILPDDQVDEAAESPCPKCGAPQLAKTEVIDYVEYLYARADSGGAKVRLVSSESEEGEMLTKAFAGVAAILRYPMGDRLRAPVS